LEILKGETEGIVVAAQDKILSTNSLKMKILKENISKCQFCKEYKEITYHETLGWTLGTGH
jgi:hypothetical protein